MMSYISRKGTRKDESFGSAQLISYHNSSKKGAAVVLNRYNDTHNNLLLSVDSVFKKTVETEINKE